MNYLKGTLNSKSVYGQSYFGGQDYRRFNKYTKIRDLFQDNPKARTWFANKFWKYSQRSSVYFVPFYANYKACVGQRAYNKDRKKKSIHLFPWRK